MKSTSRSALTDKMLAGQRVVNKYSFFFFFFVNSDVFHLSDISTVSARETHCGVFKDGACVMRVHPSISKEIKCPVSVPLEENACSCRPAAPAHLLSNAKSC